MIRLKKIRENRNLTQQYLAEALHTTQQTIARWESGKSEPSIADLRDLAILLGISVDSLIGNEKVIKTCGMMTYGEKKELKDGIEFDGFCGHLGVRLYGSDKSKWYPVTEKEYSQAHYGIQNDKWFYVETLNNKMLLINKNNVERFCLLDDACDRPAEDWDLEWHEEGSYSPEFFTALAEYENGQRDISDSLQEMIENVISEEKLSSEQIFDLTSRVTIILKNGKKESFYPNSFEDFANYTTNIDIDDEDSGMFDTIILFCEEGDFYFKGDDIAVIEVPLSKYNEGVRELDAEIEKGASVAE